MKIAVITSGFLPVPATNGGAVENLIVNLLDKNEEKKQIKFNIFSIYDESAIKESRKYEASNFDFIKPNIVIKVLDKMMFFVAKNIMKKKNSQSYRFIFQRLYYLRKVSRYLKKNDYDKVILENHPTQYLALKWKKNYLKYNGKYYYHCHNEFPGTYGCYEIIKNTKSFICVSKYIAKTLKEYLNLDENMFTVLKNGIDTDQFTKRLTQEEKSKIKENYNISPNDKIILFTGRLIPEKGIKELLLALNKMKYKNYKLLIVGASLNNINVKTKFEEELNNIIVEIGDKVIFTGFINYKEIYKFYKIADIAVLPSIWNDPAPLTIIESLVSGLPIITTDSGGIPEYVNEQCSIIIKRDNNLIANIAENIDNLLENDEKRIEMAKMSIKNSKGLNIENFYNTFLKEIKD